MFWWSVSEASPWFDAVIVHIASGDTVSVRVNGARIRCRLALADAPELDQPYGTAAKKALGKMLFNRRVLVQVIDRELMLVRLEVGGRQVDEVLLTSGLAWLTPRYAANSRLSLLQSASRSARRGLWRGAASVAPWRWRAGFRSPSTPP